MTIIDGKKLSREILAQVKKTVVSLDFQPIFCDVLVGNDLSSAQYVRMKAKTAESIGIKFHNASFPTALACMALLDSINLNLRTKNVVVLGQGELVGKPVAALLRFRGLNPTIITRKTENKEQ